jgi:HEAT repeat protein
MAVPFLLRKLKDRDREVRFYAVSALEQIGPRVEAIPALLEMLQRKDEDKLSRLRAADTLARTGDDAVVVLIGFLKHPGSDLTLRSCAATALGETESKEAVAALAGALHDADEEVRLSAAMALGNIGGTAREAVPALLQALKDPEKQVRSSSAIALSAMASGSLEVIQGLREALEDADTTVRFAVSMALRKLERKSGGT